nr:hypothetical protein [Micromonospora sp. DSM 115978]
MSAQAGGEREVLAGPGEIRTVRYFAGFEDGDAPGGLDPGLGGYVEFLDGSGASLAVLACFDWTCRFPMSDPEVAPSSLSDVAAVRGARAVADALGAELVV